MDSTLSAPKRLQTMARIESPITHPFRMQQTLPTPSPPVRYWNLIKNLLKNLQLQTEISTRCDVVRTYFRVAAMPPKFLGVSFGETVAKGMTQRRVTGCTGITVACYRGNRQGTWTTALLQLASCLHRGAWKVLSRCWLCRLVLVVLCPRSSEDLN